MLRIACNLNRAGNLEKECLSFALTIRPSDGILAETSHSERKIQAD